MLTNSIKIVLLFSLLIIPACNSGRDTAQITGNVEVHWYLAIENAHNKAKWHQQQVLKTRIVNISKGQVRFSGWMYMETNGVRSRFELDNGAVAVFDGEKAWVLPDMGFNRARFHLLTWPYFLAAPYKLGDPGSKLEELGTLDLHEKEYPAARMTFEAGTGDTPDDWYIVHKDPESQRLKALAYIVTYGKSLEEAALNPHALLYDEFEMINEIPIATKWTLWEWNKVAGVTKQLGEITLDDLSFIPMEPGLFKKPQGAVEDKLPRVENQIN